MKRFTEAGKLRPGAPYTYPVAAKHLVKGDSYYAFDKGEAFLVSYEGTVVRSGVTFYSYMNLTSARIIEVPTVLADTTFWREPQNRVEWREMLNRMSKVALDNLMAEKYPGRGSVAVKWYCGVDADYDLRSGF